jgi:hypothetical protein
MPARRRKILVVKNMRQAGGVSGGPLEPGKNLGEVGDFREAAQYLA